MTIPSQGVAARSSVADDAPLGVGSAAGVPVVPAGSGSTVPLRELTGEPTAVYEAELWCEFDCVAYVFVGPDPQTVSDRLQAARRGEHTWDAVRPLSKEELYGGLI